MSTITPRSSTDHLWQLLGRRATSADDVGAEAVATPDAEEVTGRIDVALERVMEETPAEEFGDPRDFRRAREVLLRQASSAVRRHAADPSAPLRPDEEFALEAVILTDGTRPTLPVHDDAVDADHPQAGDWTGLIADKRAALAAPIRAVGRIEPEFATASSYFGTGWVVDADAGLVLTNLHVVEAMWRRLPQMMQQTAAGFRVHGRVFIDFARESGSLRSNGFQVVEARPSGIDGPGFARLDAAVLKIEPLHDSQQVPDAIPMVPDVDGPQGNLGSFCIVGFPAKPKHTHGLHGGWTGRG